MMSQDLILPPLALLACDLTCNLACNLTQIGWFDLEKNSSGILTTRLASDASQVGVAGREDKRSV